MRLTADLGRLGQFGTIIIVQAELIERVPLPQGDDVSRRIEEWLLWQTRRELTHSFAPNQREFK